MRTLSNSFVSRRIFITSERTQDDEGVLCIGDGVFRSGDIRIYVEDIDADRLARAVDAFNAALAAPVLAQAAE